MRQQVKELGAFLIMPHASVVVVTEADVMHTNQGHYRQITSVCDVEGAYETWVQNICNIR